MSDDLEHRCRRASRCPDHEVLDDGSRVGARINAQAGLCPTCVRHVERAIEALPRDYVELTLMLGATGSGSTDRVSGTRELLVPIRLGVESLMARMVHEAAAWAESVAEVLRVDWDSQQCRDSRSGVVLQRACGLLSSAIAPLLALRDAVHVTWARDEQGDDCWLPQERDGLDGALILLDLHHRARHALGHARLVSRLPTPCPRCDRQALHRADGEDLINCHGCGRVFDWNEYETLCTLLLRRRESAA